MTVITDPTQQSSSEVSDRRRPGRMQNVSPELIPLLRKSERDAATVLDDHDVELDGDQLSAARGVLTGVVLSAPVWAIFAYVVYWLVT